MIVKPAAEGQWVGRSDDGALADGPVEVSSLMLTAGSDAATAVFHDAEAASGDSITLKAPAGESAQFVFPKPLFFATGVYVNVTGTSPVAAISCTKS